MLDRLLLVPGTHQEVQQVIDPHLMTTQIRLAKLCRRAAASGDNVSNGGRHRVACLVAQLHSSHLHVLGGWTIKLVRLHFVKPFFHLSPGDCVSSLLLQGALCGGPTLRPGAVRGRQCPH